ncbi:DUF4123 domain-containing protein [Actinobacillus equuli subsp. haemolyticus]|nr:DUF4123 domain-containing protein [Actinobacillus equuli subsp. haemolyticus]
MLKKTSIYAVDAQLYKRNEQERIIILIYAENVEVAKSQIMVYQQKNQLRLSYVLHPLPLELYFQHHGEETFILPLKTLSQDVSESNPLIIFNPNQYRENEKSETASLIKTESLFRKEEECTPFLFQPIPASIKSQIWQEDSESQCYAIINAEVSFWFPACFERSGIRFACLFKGEEGERKKKTAPYLVHLPEHHAFVEELCSEGKAGEDGQQHWHKPFGFFFRSSADFEALLHHFRKFIYMPTYDERLLYFRFYDPLVLEQYFDRLMYYPRKLATFWGGGLIEAFILPKGENVVCYTPDTHIDFAQIKPAKKQFDKFEMDYVLAERNQHLLANIVNELVEATPALAGCNDRPMIEKVVQYNFHLCNQYGLHQTIYISLFSLFNLAYGVEIDELDTEGKIAEILRSQRNGQEKLYLIKQRIAELEAARVIRNKLGAQQDGT